MDKKVLFDRLADHLSHGFLSVPKTEDLFEIFAEMFTPEQIPYALQMPIARTGAISVEDLARKMGKPLEEVIEVVEAMARACTVQAIRRGEDNTIFCSAFPVVPGIMESFFGTEIENDRKKHVAELWNKYFPVLHEKINKSTYPAMRYIPITERLDSNSRVLAFEEVSNLFQGATAITAINCHCREVMLSNRCDRKMEACIALNDWAEYLIQYRGAVRLTVEGAMQVMKECEEDGLVHMSANMQETPSMICNCCPCCCGVLSELVKLPDEMRLVARTNFAPVVDQDACTLCRSCVEICPTKAIVESAQAGEPGGEIKIVVRDSMCIGCGVCSTHCPTNAIRMKKIHDVMPPRNGMELAEKLRH
jgi:electron transport complex protein RnfB